MGCPARILTARANSGEGKVDFYEEIATAAPHNWQGSGGSSVVRALDS